MSNVHGPYQVDEETLDRVSSLEESDVGRWYVIASGCFHFVESKERGLELVQDTRRDDVATTPDYFCE